MIQLQTYQVADFSGGITDKFVDAPPNAAQTCDNLEVTINRKILSRPGSRLYNVSHPKPVTSETSRVSNLIGYDNDTDLLAVVNKRLFQYQTGGWNELLGPASFPAFSLGSASSITSHAQGLKHVILANSAYNSILKVYRDNTSTLRLRTAGLPALASTPTVGAAPGAGNSYLYAFVYKYTYQVEDKEFVDYGPVKEISAVVTGGAPGAGNPAGITNIPVLTNSGGSHYDTSNIKVEIYRTNNAGAIFYRVGEVDNGTTTFNDIIPNNTLIFQQPLYTTGDVLNNDPPPAAKYVHIAANNVCYYGNVIEGSDTITTRIRQSVANDFDSCPSSFYVDLNTEVTGLSSVRGTLIALTKKGIYRVDGTFDETGNGGMIAQVIDDTVDCVAHNSIVQVLDGIVWCASDGVYFSDGYKVIKITQELDDTYASYIANNSANLTGTYDATAKKVYWAVQSESISSDNDRLLVLDLRWGIRPQSTFTTWSGGTSFSPSSVLFFNKKLIRGDSRGYVLKHDSSYLNDSLIDVFTSPSSWRTQPILWDYTSAATSFGTISQRKWVPKVTAVFDAETNLSVLLQGINDGRRKVKPLAPIIFRSRLVWGDPTIVWGDTAVIWNFQGALQEIRRFPAGGLRTSYKQIQFTNAFSNIYKSDVYGKATVNNGAYTVTLDSLTEVWPLDIEGLYITFESDGYLKEYLIMSRTNSVITFTSGAELPPNESLKWLIRGYPKDEVLSLQSYAIYYSAYSDSISDYQGPVGTNA